MSVKEVSSLKKMFCCFNLNVVTIETHITLAQWSNQFNSLYDLQWIQIFKVAQLLTFLN